MNQNIAYAIIYFLPICFYLIYKVFIKGKDAATGKVSYKLSAREKNDITLFLILWPAYLAIGIIAIPFVIIYYTIFFLGKWYGGRSLRK